MSNFQKITPFLWFDSQAEQAVHFYVSLFTNAEIITLKKWPEESQFPSDTIQMCTFRVEDFTISAFDAGPQFQFNPSISFFVNCDSAEEADRLWAGLIDGGTALMPLDKYPFSEKYGWVSDKYGVSWQVMLSESPAPRKVMPSLLFVGDQAGKAKEAMELYTSVFQNGKIKQVSKYGPDNPPNHEDHIAFSDFELEGQLFAAMDSGLKHEFTFNEAISFFVHCKDQAEVDHLWNKLTADGGQESMCGWLKDKFGVSWQIVPEYFSEKMSNGESERTGRMFQALMKMRKIDIKQLEEAYNQ